MDPIASIARALSKLGYCSRAEGERLVAAGRVCVNQRLVQDIAHRVNLRRDRLEVDGNAVVSKQQVYLMLNKPRGLVTTASDEKGRDTVFSCFERSALPRVVPVGRLDQASEGLLLFTNDTPWADQITSPKSHLPKVYHVQVNSRPGADEISQCLSGIKDGEDLLKCETITILREGERNAWLEITLTEGKNRHIRRMLGSLGVEILRLVRIAIGPLTLGNLPKGDYRKLRPAELEQVTLALERTNVNRR
jgi:23S rRNA pseudouridine2605 synthase